MLFENPRTTMNSLRAPLGRGGAMTTTQGKAHENTTPAARAAASAGADNSPAGPAGPAGLRLAEFPRL
jgi:hypothetical protein